MTTLFALLLGSFFTTFLLILVGGLLFLWLSGTLFMRFVVKRWLKKMAQRIQDNVARQQNAHQQQYDPHFRETVNLNRDVKIQFPKRNRHFDPSKLRLLSDDADFEEVK